MAYGFLSRAVLMAALMIPLLTTALQPTPRKLCEPGVAPPSNRFNSTERLRLLREKMRSADFNVNWYLETGLNRMLSSPQPSERLRSWISGFAGSSGQVLITANEAFLFTDSRYTLQADQELDCHWQFFDSAAVTAWVAAYNVSAKVRLGVDARQIRAVEFARLETANTASVSLVPLDRNPIDELWTDGRPPRATQEIYPLALNYTGRTWQDKVAQARAAMTAAGADYLAVTGLDETAYLLNLRATVLAGVPYFPSMVLVSATGARVFVEDPAAVLANATLRRHLNLSDDGTCDAAVSAACATVHALTNISTEAAKWPAPKTVWLDDSACSQATLSAFTRSNHTVILRTTPVQLAKAVKNAEEQAAYTRCSLMDSAALVAALSQLQRKVAAGENVTELSASDLVASYRAKVADFRGLSFETIAASGPNAAVVHYRPTVATNRRVGTTEPFLLDSGGQYLGCTTDVTRTMFYGPDPPTEVRDAYTRVLMGVIDLFNLTWPARLTSRNVDAFARRHLWADTKDYGHGTGHGIGLFLGVHEGPNGIGRDVGLTEGNFQSIEPGFYQAESAGVLGFGIRLETISGVRRVDATYLRFVPVTWVPFERKLIHAELMSAGQLRWLNWYHAECKTRLTGALPEIGELDNAAAWLSAATQTIAVEVKSATPMRTVGTSVLASASLVVLTVWRR